MPISRRVAHVRAAAQLHREIRGSSPRARRRRTSRRTAPSRRPRARPDTPSPAIVTGTPRQISRLTIASISRSRSAVDRTVMSKVESQPIRRDERARLMHALAEHLAQRRVQQMRRRVIRVPCRAADRSARAPSRGRSGRCPSSVPMRRGPAVDLADIVDVDAPAVADDLAPIGDLPARLGVERRFAQHDRDAAVGEMLDRGHLRLDLDRVVADERRRALQSPARLPNSDRSSSASAETPSASPCARPANACAARRAPPRIRRCRRRSRARAPSAP